MRFSTLVRTLVGLGSAAASAIPTSPNMGHFVVRSLESREPAALEARANDYYFQGVEFLLVLSTAQQLVIRWLWDAYNGDFFNNGYDGSNAFQVNPFDSGPSSDQLLLTAGTVAQDQSTGITITSNNNVPVGDITLASGSQPGPQPGAYQLTAGTTNLDVIDGTPVTVRDSNGNAIQITSASLTVYAMQDTTQNNPPSPASDEL